MVDHAKVPADPFEQWMPIRQVAPDDKLRIWRNFQIGKLLVRLDYSFAFFIDLRSSFLGFDHA